MSYFLTFLVGAGVGALITWLVMGAYLRAARESLFWVNQQAKDARESVTKLSEQIHEMVTNPEAMQRMTARVKGIKSKADARLHNRGSKQ